MASSPPHRLARLQALAVRAHLQPPRPEEFTSPVHDTVVVARIGRWLGIAIGICFLTGLLSHNAQSLAGVGLRPWPSWGYRFTQGLHVASGIASIPLLLAKVFAAYPRLFTRPVLPRPNREGLPVILERGSIAVLVGAVFFEISTGVANINQWYVFGFGFVPVHYALAWVMVGALLVHIAVKLPIIRRSLSGSMNSVVPAAGDRLTAVESGGRDRRGFLVGALGATGLVTMLTIGQSFTPLSKLAVLAPRRPGEAALQGVPINKTAAGAGLADRLTPGWAAEQWRLTLVAPGGGERSVALAELNGLEQVSVRLPISCVEGWSINADWRGVRVRDLVGLMVDADDDHEVRVRSLEQGSPWSITTLPAAFAAHPDTILATMINGEILAPDHGYPARIIAPNRPGVLQTKWVDRLEILP